MPAYDRSIKPGYSHDFGERPPVEQEVFYQDACWHLVEPDGTHHQGRRLDEEIEKTLKQGGVQCINFDFRKWIIYLRKDVETTEQLCKIKGWLHKKLPERGWFAYKPNYSVIVTWIGLVDGSIEEDNINECRAYQGLSEWCDDQTKFERCINRVFENT